MSISTIFPTLTVKPITENGRPRGATTTPAAPFTIAGGSEEGVDDLPLAGEIGVGRNGCSLHPAAGAAGELPRGGRGAPHDGSDLLEEHRAHVVEDVGEPLWGGERLEYDEQREAYPVC